MSHSGRNIIDPSLQDSHWSITRCMVAERIGGRAFETCRLRSAPQQPISSGRGQPRTCMPRKRGIRSGHHLEFRVVRATALRKLRRSKMDLSLNELEVLAQQMRADLERIDGGTGTASSSHTAGATASRVPWWIWTSDTCRKSNRETCSWRRMRGTLTALNTRRSRMSPGRS